MGIAGAFVAVADDATAASWNPAGLVQLQKPEISGAYSVERRYSRRYSVDSPFLNGESDNTLSAINYLSFAYPFSLARRNVVFALNFQKLYDFYKNVKFSDREELHSKGKLYTISPALAIKLIDQLSVGMTINVWDRWIGNSGWKNFSIIRYLNESTGDMTSVIKKEEIEHFHGLNANLGILYSITPRLTLGAVYKTPFRGRFEYNFHSTDSKRITFFKAIEFPPVYCLGISYRISDALSLSADLSKTEWDQLLWINDKGEKFRLFSYKPEIQPNIKPTYSIRLGVEFLKIIEKTVIPFRTGIFYDPIPSINNPHDEYGISLGSGISLGDIIIDVAYQYRVRHDVEAKEIGFTTPFKLYEDNHQHLFLLSTIYHF